MPPFAEPQKIRAYMYVSNTNSEMLRTQPSIVGNNTQGLLLLTHHEKEQNVAGEVTLTLYPTPPAVCLHSR